MLLLLLRVAQGATQGATKWIIIAHEVHQIQIGRNTRPATAWLKRRARTQKERKGESKVGIGDDRMREGGRGWWEVGVCCRTWLGGWTILAALRSLRQFTLAAAEAAAAASTLGDSPGPLCPSGERGPASRASGEVRRRGQFGQYWSVSQSHVQAANPTTRSMLPRTLTLSRTPKAHPAGMGKDKLLLKRHYVNLILFLYRPGSLSSSVCSWQLGKAKSLHSAFLFSISFSLIFLLSPLSMFLQLFFLSAFNKMQCGCGKRCRSSSSSSFIRSNNLNIKNKHLQ